MVKIKDFTNKISYFQLINNKIFSLIHEGILNPLFIIMQNNFYAINDINIIIEALHKGDLYYVNDLFISKSGKFSNKISLELEKLGAKYSKRENGYKLLKDKIPQQMLVAIAQRQGLAQYKIETVKRFLLEVEQNLPYIIDSLIFNDEVITIIDDVGKQISKNVKSLNIIEPELDENQKLDIAKSYTTNMRFYIKNWAFNRIPEMRKKVEQAVLEGYREDKVQKMLEQEYGIAKRKAKFLAQNETSIMLANLKRTMYTKMGFDKFIWKTRMDGLEREDHKKLNNKIFRFDDPPIIDSRTGRTGLPGEDYNCRCLLLPYREDNIFNNIV